MKETRLDEIREEAARTGRVEAKNYYNLPLLKKPVWTWEVPAYFFVGGAAGASAMIAAAAQIGGADRKLVRDARWVAAAGAALSTPLLIADLGRPQRFLNMLRVFKVRSPMSVGAWTLAAFGTASSAAAFAEWARAHTDLPVTIVGNAAAALAAATGLVMSTYTGVLIGATVIPVWSKHASVLPMHFGASALASAVSILELLGHDEQALNILGIAAAAFETYTGYRLETNRDKSIGPTMRLAGVFSGPLPAILRLAGFTSRNARTAAAAATLIGSLITRIAWIEAGKTSAEDVKTVLG
jgi:hypothetical protein